MSVMIWVQTVCKRNQQTTKLDPAVKQIAFKNNTIKIYLHVILFACMKLKLKLFKYKYIINCSYRKNMFTIKRNKINQGISAYLKMS